jgi:dTDP-4-dehydrorhamnose reductase
LLVVISRKLLATGASGMVGGYLPETATRATHDDLDVTDFAQVVAVLEGQAPDAVLHLAAETNVDLCEQEPDHAYRLNALGTRNVAQACAQLDVPLVYISSAQVFDGEKHEPYHEFDATAPRTVYGRSKLAGEEFVRQFVPRSWVVRASWMVGGGPRGEKKFIAKMLDHAERMGRIVAVDDKYGSVTLVPHLLHSIDGLLDSGQFGTAHVVNPGMVTRFDVARFVRDTLDLPYEVERASSARFPLPAPRGRSEALDPLVMRLMGFPEAPPWDEALGDYLRAEWAPFYPRTITASG